jgi:hypothetical protein
LEPIQSERCKGPPLPLSVDQRSQCAVDVFESAPVTAVDLGKPIILVRVVELPGAASDENESFILIFEAHGSTVAGGRSRGAVLVERKFDG